MRRIRLTVAYDGTNYCGWQIQPNGITIEEVLNKAICKLTGEEIQVIWGEPDGFRGSCKRKYCCV